MKDEAFRTFFELTQRPLLGYLRKALGDEAMAEDLLQESYMRFLDRPPASSEAGVQRVYLFTIATRLMRDHWRRQRSFSWLPWRWQKEEGMETLEPISRAPDPHQIVQDRQLVALGFRGLSLRQRQLLWLAYVEGLDHKEIAQTLGITKHSVRVLLHRARKRMNITMTNLNSSGGAS